MNQTEIDALKRRITDLEKSSNELGEISKTSGPISNAMTPPKFNGRTDFITYLKTFNRYATALNWSPTRCVQTLPAFLEEDALAVFDTIDPDERKNWKDLTDKLEKGLAKLNLTEIARKKLANRKQRKDESIIQFAKDIVELVDTGFPEKAMENSRPGLVIDYFRQGLKSDLKEKLLYMDKPVTIEEAIAQARKVNDIVDDQKQELLSQLRTQLVEKEFEATKNTVNVIKNQHEDLEERVNQITEQTTGYGQNFGNGNINQYGQRPQFYGGRGGSFGQQRGNNENRGFYNSGLNRGYYNSGFGNRGNFYNNNRGGNFNGDYNGVKCYNCERFGHLARDCRTNLNARGNGNYIEVQNRGRGNYNNNRGTDRRGRGNRGRGNYIINTLPFLTVVMMAMLINSMECSQQGVFQICPKETKGMEVQIPDFKCEVPKDMESKQINVTVYLPVVNPRKFPIYRCHHEITRICTDTNFGIWAEITKNEVYMEPTTGDECWSVVVGEKKLERKSENIWSSNIPARAVYDFHAKRCDLTRNFVFQRGTAGVLLGKLVTNWNEAFDPGAELVVGEKQTWIWEIPQDETYIATHVSVGRFQAIQSNKMVALLEPQSAFVIDDDQDKSDIIGVPETAIKMNSDAFMVIEEEKPRQKRELRTSSKPKKNTKAAPTTVRPLRRMGQEANKKMTILTTEEPTTKMPMSTSTTPTLTSTMKSVMTTTEMATKMTTTTQSIPTQTPPTIKTTTVIMPTSTTTIATPVKLTWTIEKPVTSTKPKTTVTTVPVQMTSTVIITTTISSTVKPTTTTTPMTTAKPEATTMTMTTTKPVTIMPKPVTMTVTVNMTKTTEVKPQTMAPTPFAMSVKPKATTTTAVKTTTFSTEQNEENNSELFEEEENENVKLMTNLVNEMEVHSTMDSDIDYEDQQKRN